MPAAKSMPFNPEPHQGAFLTHRISFLLHVSKQQGFSLCFALGPIFQGPNTLAAAPTLHCCQVPQLIICVFAVTTLASTLAVQCVLRVEAKGTRA